VVAAPSIIPNFYDIAIIIAPEVIRATPTAFEKVIFSAKNKAAKTRTKTTLDLSIEAT
jgi:hypothetical protein